MTDDRSRQDPDHVDATHRQAGRELVWIGPARAVHSMPRRLAADRRYGRAGALRVGWITGVIRGRIPWPSHATRTRWGATRPRLLPAVPAMLNHSDTRCRRRLQFDPLEGRQLLNGGDWPVASVEVLAPSEISPIQSVPIRGLEQLPGTEEYAISVGPRALAVATVFAAFDGPAAMVDQAPQGPHWGPMADPASLGAPNAVSSMIAPAAAPERMLEISFAFSSPSAPSEPGGGGWTLSASAEAQPTSAARGLAGHAGRRRRRRATAGAPCWASSGRMVTALVRW